MAALPRIRGDWFRWRKKGPAVAARLFCMQYEYFVGKYGLHNLLRMGNCQLVEGYPGDDVVDILPRDSDAEKGTRTDYQKEYAQLRALAQVKKPVDLAEIGIQYNFCGTVG